MVKVPDQGCSRRKALRVRAALGTSRYGHHTGSEGAARTSERITHEATPAAHIHAQPQKCFSPALNPLESKSLVQSHQASTLTGQVLFIHAVAGRLHGHLEHPDAAVVGRQHDLV